MRRQQYGGFKLACMLIIEDFTKGSKQKEILEKKGLEKVETGKRNERNMEVLF